MEKHRILFNDQWIEYQIIYKNIKSVYFKVESGHLIVKAPYSISQSFIEDHLHLYQDKLLKQINHFLPLYDYQPDGYVYIFGESYHLVMRDVGKKQCQIHDHDLYVYHSQLEQIVELFLRKMLLDYIEERVIYYLAHDFDLDMPQIVIKKYKARWGSCYYKENKISFNLYLIHLDKELIDYVIVHELTHFLEANHSSHFYHEIEKRMPDYRNRQKRLKEISI